MTLKRWSYFVNNRFSSFKRHECFIKHNKREKVMVPRDVATLIEWPNPQTEVDPLINVVDHVKPSTVQNSRPRSWGKDRGVGSSCQGLPWLGQDHWVICAWWWWWDISDRSSLERHHPNFLKYFLPTIDLSLLPQTDSVSSINCVRNFMATSWRPQSCFVRELSQ